MALRAVIDAPDLELVGVRVYDPEKVGADAGDLAGRPATGVRATDSKDELLALAPDVVLYMGRVETNPEGCFTDVADLLAAGADVIATGSSFVDTRAFDLERHQALAAACEKGRSTFLGLGLFPGFWGEVVAPVLSRLAFQCDRIFVREHLSYAEYPSTQLIFDVMGYGHAPDATGPLLSDPRRAAGAFTGTATILAKSLGLAVASVEPFREVAVTDRELTVAAGVIPAGTVGAMRLGVLADCGPVTIAVEHVTWMAPDVAPRWSAPGEGYQIEFDGAPTLRCTLVLGTRGEDHTDMGCLATAMHAVHAIPAVRAAAPGVLDLADVPTFLGRLPWPT
ncbi:dihydrodipicolinate reductase [Frankia sp. CNm7]|nr:dihydrodipicolinate reductase [Frankia nepalensis]MBL7514275.1 dihydrodipicolinate reductase [Frankia nepalensis]MBL7523760.1 dihydrodipicolinate reductase [Frankia nepalensis]